MRGDLVRLRLVRDTRVGSEETKFRWFFFVNVLLSAQSSKHARAFVLRELLITADYNYGQRSTVLLNLQL